MYTIYMRTAKQAYAILTSLHRGEVYRLEQLARFSNAISRDTKKLTNEGFLRKVAPGMYYYPNKYTLGELPPEQRKLVQTFLKSKDFLLFSPNLFNSLELGLTQLKNEMWVYNKARSGKIKLGNYTFNFKRPLHGFPKKLSKEFLLVDLMNNIAIIGEEHQAIQANVKQKIGNFDKQLLTKMTKEYGKVGTKKFFYNALEQ